MLIAALLDRFPTHEQAERFFDLEMDRPLAYVTKPDGLEAMYYAVVRDAIAEGWIGELVTTAARYRPDDRFSALGLAVPLERPLDTKASDLTTYDPAAHAGSMKAVTTPDVSKTRPRLEQPWMFAGSSTSLKIDRRAKAQMHRAQGGDLFRGRVVALEAVSNWLNAPSPGRPLVITGQPGSGKSAVVARAALAARVVYSRGLFYDASGMSISGFVRDIGDFVGLAGMSDIDEIIEYLHERPPGENSVLMVDALDEASSHFDVSQIAEALAELSRLPTFRIVVSTRALAVGNRFRPGSLLGKLLVSTETAANLIDLDRDPFRDKQAIETFVEASLSQDGARFPGPAGCAWEQYRARDHLRSALASLVAQRADDNFLVAAISATALSTFEEIVDPYGLDFDPATLPSNLKEALEKYLSTVGKAERRQTTSLLTALSFARGDGVDEQRWLLFAAALGYSVTESDLEELCESAGADFLLQVESGDGGRRSFRLFHRALAEELRAKHDERSEVRIYESIHREVHAGGGWSLADNYAVRYLADHAASANCLASLLTENEYLGYAHIPSLVSAIELLEPSARPLVGRIVALEEARLHERDADGRLWLLAICALHAGDSELRSGLISDRSMALMPEWALPLASEHRKCIGHLSSVSALAVGRLARDDVIVSGDRTGTIFGWNQRGRALFGPLIAHQDAVTAIHIGRIEDEDVFVTASRDLSVRVWRPDGKLIGDPFVGHTKAPSLVGIEELNGQPVIVSTAPRGEILAWNTDGNIVRRLQFDFPLAALGTIDGALRVLAAGYNSVATYSVDTGRDRTLRRIGGRKSAIAFGRLGRINQIFLAVHDGPIQAFRTDGADSLSKPLNELSGRIRTMSVGRFGAGECIAAATSEASAIWDYRGNLLVSPWNGPPGSSGIVALGSSRGQSVVARAGTDKVVRLWRDRALLSRVQTSNLQDVADITAAQLGTSVMVVSTNGSALESRFGNGTLAWSLPRPAFNSYLVKFSRGPERVIITANDDDVLRIYNPEQGLPEKRCTGQRTVRALATGFHDGREVIASAGSKGIVIWTLSGGYERTLKYPRITSICNQLEFGIFSGRDALYALMNDDGVYVYDFQTGMWTAKTPAISAVRFTCFTTFETAGSQLVALGDESGRIWTWRPGAPAIHNSSKSHGGPVAGIAELSADGSVVALVTISDDATIGLWTGMDDYTSFALGEKATKIATTGNSVFVAAGPAVSALSFDRTRVPTAESAPGAILAKWLPIQWAREATRLLDEVTPGKWKALYQKPLKRQILIARDLIAKGARRKVILRLRPHLAVSPEAVCVAADAAFLSGSYELLSEVLPYLGSENMLQEQAVQGRLFVLAILLGQLEVADVAVQRMSQSSPLNAGLAEILDLDPMREWDVYRAASSGYTDSVAASSFALELAAMRLLAVARRISDGTSNFDQVKERLLSEYNSWASQSLLERLRVTLRDFINSADGNGALYPYQVASVLEVLNVGVPLDSSFREELLERTKSELVHAGAEVRASFAEWSPYSSWAAAVAAAVISAQADPSLIALLRDSVRSVSEDDGYANLARVGNQIRQLNSSFNSRSYGHGKLVNLFKATGLFDIQERIPAPGRAVVYYVRERLSNS